MASSAEHAVHSARTVNLWTTPVDGVVDSALGLLLQIRAHTIHRIRNNESE
jgi:hypothetical protein